jgi:hypothetical protein
MTDIVERLLQQVDYLPREVRQEAAATIKRLRAVVTRAKDALIDGQSTQWVHDLLVAELLSQPSKPELTQFTPTYRWLIESVELLLRHQIELREELRNNGILR